MKKLLRLSELKRYYEEKSPSKIIYCTDNQEPDGEDGFQSIGIAFRAMAVSVSPDLIILKIGDGYIRFSCAYYRWMMYKPCSTSAETSLMTYCKVALFQRFEWGRSTIIPKASVIDFLGLNKGANLV